MSDDKTSDRRSGSPEKHPKKEDNEIVLSVNESPMPHGVTGDWAAEEGESQDRADALRKDRGQKKDRQLHWPEALLWRKYAGSRMHQRLHNSRQWYRSIEKHWRVGTEQPEAESTEARPRHLLQRFVVGNPFTTVLFCLLAVGAGRTGIDFLLEAPVQREQAPVSKKGSAPTVPSVTKNRLLPTASLEHCSLTKRTKAIIATLDHATKLAVLAEINRFHFILDASGLQQEWQQLSSIQQVTDHVAREVLRSANGYHTSLVDKRARHVAQREELIQALDSDQISGLYDVDDINRRIRRRGALEREERALAAGPAPAQLAVLGLAIEGLRRRLGEVGAGVGPEELVATQSERIWAEAAQELTRDQMERELNQLYQSDVRNVVEAGVAESAALNRYRLDRMISAVRSINQLIDLQNDSFAALPNLDSDEAAINSRLVELLGTPAAGGLLNYSACLGEHESSRSTSSK